ncbi:MAG: hypothetical protein GYA60_02095 [Candidatus Methanofastidiosa archaeon]|nr:hypothetical protein [Candidatus Methanofastidiosa archaeon]
MDSISNYSSPSKKTSEKKNIKEFLLSNLKKSSEEFDYIDKDADIPKDKDINEKIFAISKNCHEILERSIKALNEPLEEEKLRDIEDCAMGISELRSWIETSKKNKTISLEIDYIADYTERLKEMVDKMKFIDSIDNNSHDNFMMHIRKRREKE